MTAALIQDVSDTALWVATYRALETERPDALFRDPWAKLLAGDKGQDIAKQMRLSRYTAWSVVIRTCVIDTFIKELIAQGVDTVLNCGAGLDTRPYRLDLPPTLQWIEVDYPHIIALKDERLRDETPKCKLQRVALDLADLKKRRQLFADIAAQSKKVLVITEGVMPYLTNEQVASFAHDLRMDPKFRFWIVDYFSGRMMKYMRKMRRIKNQLQNAPIQFEPNGWAAFFAAQGWRPFKTRYLAEASEDLHRPVPAPWWAKVLGLITPKARRERFKKFLAYVVLEPV